MANDGQIVFEVTADGKHAIADIKDITRAIQQETNKWDDAAKQSTDNISNNFSGMLKKLAAGFSAVKVGKALLDIGKDAIAAASDLQEVQNVVDATFGSNANKIDTWAKNAGTQFGLTETQAKKFSSTMGAMLKSSGVAGDKIVDVSTDLAGLAADMASFYNLDFDTAFQKIRSGISGETEPLKQLGINMSVVNLEAFAMTQGISKAFNEMSQGEQAMLRYQYLMQATADAQGDFARTSDGYANGIRTLETNLTNLKTNLGNVFLEVVNPLVKGINSLFADRSGEKTVLDDFAGIDEETSRKIESIKQTAEDARYLVEELDKLGGAGANKAGSNIQQIATDLSNISFDQGKAGIVKDFIAALAQDIPTLAGLQGTDAEGAAEWLNNIGKAADSLDPEDAAGWQSLINTIKEGLPGFENTDFGSAFFAALGGGFSDVESKASVLEWAIDTLGNKTNKTAEEQAYWLQVCKSLVKTIPGLSSIINTETGEIQGGTQAIKDYIKAWEDGQTKLVLLGALEEKESALASRFSDLPGLQLDMALEKRRAKQRMEELKAVYQKYGAQIGLDANGKISRDYSSVFGLTDEARKELTAAADAYDEQAEKAQKAIDSYNLQKEALEEAKLALQEYRETVNEMPGEVQQAADKTEKYWADNAENIKIIVSAAADAVAAMEDYATGVQNAMLNAVNSVVKGLDGVDYQKYGNEIEKIDKLIQEQSKYKVGSEEWEKLQQQINKANESLVSTDNIYKNLEEQSSFIDDYLANLQKAREMGLSAELLAELSDGSTQSAEYLDALVNDKTGKTAKEIDDLYTSIQEKKAQLAKELGDQQLTVDQTYQSLAANAKEAVAALDLQGEAKDNAGKTVAGMAQGIAEHISDVQEAVDGIVAQLDRLSGYGIDIDFGGFGHISFTTSTGKSEGSGRMGIPLVPHDDYIARLHEGERVLTAQENQIWNALRNGGVAGFDLETLGGVMRDNVKAGGNVYLDGRVVGSVISDQQGKTYRQLQRSGWQG